MEKYFTNLARTELFLGKPGGHEQSFLYLEGKETKFYLFVVSYSTLFFVESFVGGLLQKLE